MSELQGLAQRIVQGANSDSGETTESRMEFVQTVDTWLAKAVSATTAGVSHILSGAEGLRSFVRKAPAIAQSRILDTRTVTEVGTFFHGLARIDKRYSP